MRLNDSHLVGLLGALEGSDSITTYATKSCVPYIAALVKTSYENDSNVNNP